MKLWERVIERRLREVMMILANQFGLMPNRSTTKAIHLVRRFMDLYKDRKKDPHVMFVNLEKTYDRVSSKVL